MMVKQVTNMCDLEIACQPSQPTLKDAYITQYKDMAIQEHTFISEAKTRVLMCRMTRFNINHRETFIAELLQMLQ